MGGGVYILPGGGVTLRLGATVTGNTSASGDGGFYGVPSACDASGVDTWTGLISPNAPDTPPAVSSVPCS